MKMSMFTKPLDAIKGKFKSLSETGAKHYNEGMKNYGKGNRMGVKRGMSNTGAMGHGLKHMGRKAMDKYGGGISSGLSNNAVGMGIGAAYGAGSDDTSILGGAMMGGMASFGGKSAYSQMQTMGGMSGMKNSARNAYAGFKNKRTGGNQLLLGNDG
jgi:hypothetical protein